jgi:hypothetical protein
VPAAACVLQVRTTEWLAYCHFHFGEHDQVGWLAFGLALRPSR